MFKPCDLIRVSIGDEVVGRLALTSDFRCAFEYDGRWLQEGYSISPFYLPLQSGVFTARRDPFKGLFGVFNDSLPDGWGNLLIDRLLMKSGVVSESLSALDRLSIVGTSGMGALTYKPENTFEEVDDISDLDFLASEVEKILNEDYSGSIGLLEQKAGSSGGARPKVLLDIDDEPWLVKFRSSADPANIGELEYHCSLIAKQCGIEMPETRLFQQKYFGVRRFDRQGDKRIHLHSASGLLYASHRYPSLDYTELMKATLALCGDMDEMSKMFRLMVFNVLIGNKDDHAKNFSFLYGEGHWKLSPAYDLVGSDGFNGQHTTTVAGQGRPSRKDLFEVAARTGFSSLRAGKIFDEVYEGCRDVKIVSW